jgi:hypothetical protein
MSGVPAYSFYGRPANDARLAHMDGARLAAPSAPYLGRGNLCAANEDTCTGRKAKGTDYCFGHARSMGLIKKGKETDGTTDVE